MTPPISALHRQAFVLIVAMTAAALLLQARLLPAPTAAAIAAGAQILAPLAALLIALSAPRTSLALHRTLCRAACAAFAALAVAVALQYHEPLTGALRGTSPTATLPTTAPSLITLAAFALVTLAALPILSLPSTRYALLQLLLDALILLTATAILAASLTLPALLNPANGPASIRLPAGLALAAQLALLLPATLLLLHSTRTTLRPHAHTFALAALINLAGATTAIVAAAHHTGLDHGATLCSATALLLFALTLRALPDAALRQEGTTAPAWPRLLIPYAAVPAAATLLLQFPREGAAPTLIATTLLLLALTLARQSTALLENRQLTTILEDRNTEIQAKSDYLEAINARMENLITADPLTGLYTHSAFSQALDCQIADSHSHGTPFALLFLDLDHFKALNDTCGHQAGDATLIEFAGLMRTHLPSNAVLGRWGGEEFVTILPDTTLHVAQDTANCFRSIIATHPFSTTGGGYLTTSLGLALYPQHAQSGKALVTAADNAMYAAKRLGRNQIRTPDEPAVKALQDPTNANNRDDLALQGTVEALATLVAARDQYTAAHSDAVISLATATARNLDLSEPEIHLIELAARLHDVGKVAIPDHVLRKTTGPLTDTQWKSLRQHPVIGAEVISHIPALRMLSPLIRSHHERWDGKGYPDGLAGNQIPIGARIIAVADAFRALTADRPYQHCRTLEAAITELRRCAGTQFDPDIVEALVHQAATIPPIPTAEILQPHLLESTA